MPGPGRAQMPVWEASVGLGSSAGSHQGDGITRCLAHQPRCWEYEHEQKPEVSWGAVAMTQVSRMVA